MSRKNRRAKKNKKAVITNSPSAKDIKTPPKITNPPPAFRGGHIAWRFSGADQAGPYSWANLSDASLFKTVIDSLKHLEPMNEEQLAARGCHFIELDNLSKPARERLIEIKLDDLDELYSLRIMGKQRVFCVHRLHYMRVLWWDPEHQVCPSQKKHT